MTTPSRRIQFSTRTLLLVVGAVGVAFALLGMRRALLLELRRMLMTDQERATADDIRSAFQGVTLGRGVGLIQGKGLDDYADAAALRKLRAEDEVEDWSRIATDRLSRYSDSLSFMDQEGMRFHLPAFLIADLEGALDRDLLFHLCYARGDAESRFDLLDARQRAAVRRFLQLRMSDPNYEFQWPMIRSALENYWGRESL